MAGAHLCWTCALGQPPNANHFCHQDTEGLDTDQLLPPTDRLLERRWALSKIDSRCQKMISPQPHRRPSEELESQAAMPPGAGGQAGSQVGGPYLAQLLPGVGSLQFPGEKSPAPMPGALGPAGSLAFPQARAEAPAWVLLFTSASPSPVQSLVQCKHPENVK